MLSDAFRLTRSRVLEVRRVPLSRSAVFNSSLARDFLHTFVGRAAGSPGHHPDGKFDFS